MIKTARRRILPTLAPTAEPDRLAAPLRATDPTRRRLIRAAVAAVVAVANAPAASAQSQIARAEALYQDHPKNGFSCAACALFRPPAACAVVAGSISPRGWCRFFDLPD
jgi:hypothetical protein